ncbi:hypothetical protein CEK25_001308 [Fusarium fujikuroi]|nr:hypothetical protein CEK25_001308 [Fusarium fujikuroi]
MSGVPLGRRQLENFQDSAPARAENCRPSCTGEGYKGSGRSHRIVVTFINNDGDFLRIDASGATSSFEDENFQDDHRPLIHDQLCVSWTLTYQWFSILHHNRSHTFITTDNKHVVFGKHVVDGMDVEKMEVVPKLDAAKTG